MGSLIVNYDDEQWRKGFIDKERALAVKGQAIIWKAAHRMRNEVMGIIENEPKGKHKGAIGSTGDLRKRIHVEQGHRAGIISTVVKPGVHYAVFVHEGTRPHWAPLAPLETWVRRKLRIKGDSEVTGVAKQIQYKISQKGTRKFPFFRIAEKRHGKDIQRVIANDIREVLSG